MVAITVILAAVIASFVLGLGDSADEVQPNSNFAFDLEPEDTLTIELTDGESIDADEVVLRGSGLDVDLPGEDLDESNDSVASGDIGDEWSVGQSIDLDLGSSDSEVNDNGGTINVVWESTDGDSSATLGSFGLDEDDVATS